MRIMIDNDINIGLIIEQKINELGINKSEFGRMIGIANQNVNRILERKSIDTDKLITISNALKYNFFSEFTENVSNTATANGNGSVAVSGNNNSHVIAASDAILLERIKSLEALLSEKERLIRLYEKMINQ